MKKLSISGLFCLISLAVFSQMNWPLESFTSQHNIVGTLGEFRSSSNNPRFHKGIDITNGSNYNVYAIEGGTATYIPDGPDGINSYIKVTNSAGSILYIHVNSAINNGPVLVSAGQFIGTMKVQSAIHLHLQNADYNFLSARLYPFIDNVAPNIYSVNFRQNGHKFSGLTTAFTTQVNINGQNHTLLYNKVDIDAKVSGPGVAINGNANSNTVAPYSISYDVLNYTNNSSIGGPVENIKFDQIPNLSSASYVFGNGTTFSPAVYYYILTSHLSTLPYDRYWNTAIKTGVLETWPNTTTLDARYNDEAVTPDGQYSIPIVAKDVDFAQNPSLISQQIKKVLIDNYRPYIKTVEMYSGNLIYNAGWNWNNSLGQLVFSPNTLLGIASSSNDLIVKITASEPMQDIVLSIPSLNFSNTNPSPIPSTNNKQWEFIIPSTNIAGTTVCHHSLLISGHDLAGNPIQSNPALISKRNLNGTWSPPPVIGNDTYHNINTGNGLSITLASTNSTPPNFTNGTATVIAPEAQSILWSNGETTSTINNLSPGIYSVTVTSSSGCTASGSVTVMNSSFPTYCSGLTTFTNPSGYFNDGSGDNDYGNNSNCSWLIQPNNATSISLLISSFSTEYQHDTLIVYNGTNDTFPILGVFSGTANTTLITAEGNSMYLKFTSDDTITNSGWYASYSSNIDSTGCIPPVSQNAINITDYSAFLNWSGFNSAESYIYRYKDTTLSAWSTGATLSSSVNIIDLLPCKTYEYQVATKCSAIDTSEFSSSFIFSTIGCDTTNETTNIIAYQYWFDGNFYNNNYVPVPFQNTFYMNETFSTLSLANGLHSFHIRFLDENGFWSSVVSEVFHKLPASLLGNRKISAYEYWFDNEFSSKVYQQTALQQTFLLSSAINTASLTSGLHNFHIRYKDDAGQWSSVVSEVFHKLPSSLYGERKISAYEYWFDNDYLGRSSQSVSPQQTFILNSSINAEAVSMGLHSFHIRYKDDAGQWSSVVSEVFHKLPSSTTGNRNINGYEYWFDNEYAAKVVQSVSPQQTYILNTALATSSLPLGLHNFHIRYKDDADQWSSVVSEVFFKIGIAPSTNNMIAGYRYWFDMDDLSMVSQTLPTPVNPYQFVQNIYAGNLSLGEHWIHFQFRDVAGQWSSIVSAQFTFVGPVEQTAVSTGTISNGETNCYDALQTITVAGNGATFTIQTGGSASMIAGQKIIYFPNTIVQHGGYMLGQIAPGGPFCLTPTMPAVLKENEIPATPSLVSENSSVKIYPNPTTGKFIVELKGEIPGKFQVDIFGIRGEKLYSEALFGERKHKFSLSDKPIGVYFVRVRTDGKVETAKLIKQ